VPPRYSAAVAGSGENLAYDEPAATIDPKLTEHSRKMAKRIYRSADTVYCAVGYGIANMTMIEGTDGIVIVDTLESIENAREVMAEFRKITAKPVKAIVYTHNHYDHVMGAEGVVRREDVAAGRVPIYAHERLVDGLEKQLSVVGEAIGVRSMYTFGTFLGEGPEGSVNEGIGPKLVIGTAGFIPPTRTFADRLEVNVAGLRLELIYAPSETDDEIVVWMPERRVLQSAEVIQGEAFPNLYTIRGTTYRDPVQWYESIDRLRELGPEYLVPSHGRPVEGKAEVDSLLTAYRDAIQFAHDQAVRLINRGYTPDEVADALPALPPRLAAHPWVEEFYGTVKHSVRGFYAGYLGWFEGDPTALDPLPPRERARRHIELMGGRDAVLGAARKACDATDYRWCAELLTYLVRVDHEDHEARSLKAEALRQLGFQQKNINWRNFYLSAALELEGKLDVGRFDLSRGITILSKLPFSSLLEKLVLRLDPEKAGDAHMTLAIRLTDRKEDYALEIRRGIVQLHRSLPSEVDVTVAADEDVMRRILLRQTNFLKELVLRRVEVIGSKGDLSTFFGYFEPPSGSPAAIVVR
ncbi:MAG TPA: alkyl sulfatase dimerization domain-containing protein, partial [Candidatus Binatia bacterium]|nr:alkyl sulfatase dimerization domain-containing protein [Candidatus Binatia bacterium]